MAKDPAVLWYWNDWSGGTITLSRYAKGCYMDLLHAQFNNGHLSDAEVRTVLSQDYGQYWPLLSKKFAKDSDGNYYNCRLDEEIQRRKIFSLKQSANGKKGGRPKAKKNPNINPTLKPNISLLENENETAIETEFQKGVQGGKFSDTWFKSIFDEIHLGKIKSIFPKHDVDNELKIFTLKVTSAKTDYDTHDTGGIRKAFIYQLKNSTSTNGNGTNNSRGAIKGTARRADAIIEEGKDFGTL